MSIIQREGPVFPRFVSAVLRISCRLFLPQAPPLSKPHLSASPTSRGDAYVCRSLQLSESGHMSAIGQRLSSGASGAICHPNTLRIFPNRGTQQSAAQSAECATHSPVVYACWGRMSEIFYAKVGFCPFCRGAILPSRDRPVELWLDYCSCVCFATAVPSCRAPVPVR